MQLIFDKSRENRRGITFGALDVPEASPPSDVLRKEPARLPELSELDVVRHFTNLSRRNFGVDSHFYPLGSCTMKYNPKIAFALAGEAGFSDLHPHFSSSEKYLKCCQGALEIVYETEKLLAEIAGMDEVSLQPIAGAHGELAGTLLIAAYHRDKGNAAKDTIIIPDSAHGTNPASAAIAGFKVVEVPSSEDGTIHLESFSAVLDESTAGVMLTCPNTHGLFEPDVRKIADMAHEVDALMYYDGANLNAIMGRCRPGDLGFDVMHFNLHKTFATPHGMGGPGSGPVGVGGKLVEFMPGPRVIKDKDVYRLEEIPKSIGKMSAFFGNFLVAVQAYAYIRQLGAEGLKDVTDNAVLNANYVLARLEDAFAVPFSPNGDKLRVMHECVLSASEQAKNGVRALDIAKSLLDRGMHAPTVYFPLTVKESIMIEPTETESKETMDEFCDAMLEIAQMAQDCPGDLNKAPVNTPVGRLDEVYAAKTLNCSC